MAFAKINPTAFQATALEPSTRSIESKQKLTYRRLVRLEVFPRSGPGTDGDWASTPDAKSKRQTQRLEKHLLLSCVEPKPMRLTEHARDEWFCLTDVDVDVDVEYRLSEQPM